MEENIRIIEDSRRVKQTIMEESRRIMEDENKNEYIGITYHKSNLVLQNKEQKSSTRLNNLFPAI